MTDTLTATLPTREVTLAWSDALSLELDFMDDTHREFVDLLAATELADDDTLTERFAALIEHTEEHFGGEDKWMKDTKFSSTNCHTTQHQVVLEVMRAYSKHCNSTLNPPSNSTQRTTNSPDINMATKDCAIPCRC
jgi:hemerythrin-like metal-binding protein